MTKKQPIALADKIRAGNSVGSRPLFSPAAIESLAEFCQAQNPAFKRGRWLDYIAGKCGPNGGAR